MSTEVRADGVPTAERILRSACGDRVRTGFPLAPLTTFRIGGPAALYLEPQTDDDLRAASTAVRESGIPFVVLGKGSNVLVSDEGFPGLVLRLGKGFRWTARAEYRLTAGGSMPLPALAGVALTHSLSGLEFGVAIPASLGGAVRMNAGAHHHSLHEVVETVQVFSMMETTTRSIPADDAGFRYRNSALPTDGVVTATTLLLRPGERDSIRAEMQAARDWRRATQPLAEPNCGSVFKNPAGDHAARMVEAVGGKELSVGGAHVSGKHANFIIAGDGVRATDVVRLIALLRERVFERFAIWLDPEVHLIGPFDQDISRWTDEA